MRSVGQPPRLPSWPAGFVGRECLSFRFRAAGGSNDATLPGLPTGSTVNVRVTAVNNAGESQPSATVSIVVP